MEINLNDGEVVVDGTRVTINSEKVSYSYKLPKGARRLTLYRGANPTLTIGGFKSITCKVIGPLDVLEGLREALL